MKVDLSRGNGIARAVRIETNLIKVLNCNTKAEIEGNHFYLILQKHSSYALDLQKLFSPTVN